MQEWSQLLGGDSFFEQGLAADRAGDTDSRKRGQVGSISDSAGGLPCELRKPGLSFGIQVGVGPGERAIALDIRAQDVFDAIRRESLHSIPQTQGRTLCPPASAYARYARRVEPHIECETDPLRTVSSQPVRHLSRAFYGGTANDNARDALRKQVVDGVRGAYASAYLKADSALRSERHNDAAIGKRPILGAIEIHDMQPGRAQPPIPAQQLARLTLISRLSPKVSLQQSLGAAVHVSVSGENSHHMIEACFKGVGRALRQAFRREGEELPTTKGVL